MSLFFLNGFEGLQFGDCISAGLGSLGECIKWMSSWGDHT